MLKIVVVNETRRETEDSRMEERDNCIIKHVTPAISILTRKRKAKKKKKTNASRLVREKYVINETARLLRTRDWIQLPSILDTKRLRGI